MTAKPRRGLTEQAADAAVDQACRMLHLPTIRAQVPDLADAAAREQLSYRGFLAEMLMAECDDRARRRSERQIKAAGFPREKSLRAFDFDANPAIDPAVVNTLATCDWVRKGLPLCPGRRGSGRGGRSRAGPGSRLPLAEEGGFAGDGGRGLLLRAGRGLLGSAGLGEAVGVGAGLDDVAAEGEAVDDGGAEAGVGEGLGPAIRGWHMFVLAHLPCCLRVRGSFSFWGSLRFESRMLGSTLFVQV